MLEVFVQVIDDEILSDVNEDHCQEYEKQNLTELDVLSRAAEITDVQVSNVHSPHV